MAVARVSFRHKNKDSPRSVRTYFRQNRTWYSEPRWVVCKTNSPRAEARGLLSLVVSYRDDRADLHPPARAAWRLRTCYIGRTLCDVSV